MSLPSDLSDESDAPSYILASRLHPTYSRPVESPQGVQQILVLSRVNKACILCNGSLSFYTLPELSPAFGNNTVVSNCTWVGGTNLNDDNSTAEDGEVVMICHKARIRLVRIGEEARRIKNIEYPSCLGSLRRDDIACVADASSYALLDVQNQQKIPLFPISSLDDSVAIGGPEESIKPEDQARERSLSISHPISSEGPGNGKGHGRSTSLGALVGGLARKQPSPQPKSPERRGFLTGLEPFEGNTSSQPTRVQGESGARSPNRISVQSDKPLPEPPEIKPERIKSEVFESLTPHICSPTPTEFLLTTGTSSAEAGVGIFVNMDGDVVRGTLQFGRYPSTLIVATGRADGGTGPGPPGEDDEGYVFATMRNSIDDRDRDIVEIQRWDEDGKTPEDLIIPEPNQEVQSNNPENPGTSRHGVRSAITAGSLLFAEVGERLRAQRLRFPKARGDGLPSRAQSLENNLEPWEITRLVEEKAFGRRLGEQMSHVVVWSGGSVWWIAKNPLVLRIDSLIDTILHTTLDQESYSGMDRNALIHALDGIPSLDARTETEFLSLGYIRQKVSLILLADALVESTTSPRLADPEGEITESFLMAGNIDPRVILSLIPLLREDIVEGQKGIWIHSGLISVVESYWKILLYRARAENADLDLRSLALIRKYLAAWRQRKGFGSIPDEIEVFKTVDAGLLHVLLEQDQRHLKNPAASPSSKVELFAVVDSGVDCFDHAIDLLERYRRLYVLSRLYQSRKLARKVLETWKRIIEGEPDDGGEFIDGENEVRKYLIIIRDTALVDEYGTWLAARNPPLGVQVFTNAHSKVKWEPQQAIALLQRRAPDAVKVYLEHLVFGKKNTKYANTLILHYLDSVLAALSSPSSSAADILAQSYESYRALQPPKPTYRQFIMDNAMPASWWQDRLRLLELLGGSHGADLSYDIPSVLSRIEPYEQSLVPESIILDGRQGRHQQALKLLTHGLGDYHTAINYCLLGGASIFHPITGSLTPSPHQDGAPAQETQGRLFGFLLREFLAIDDSSDRIERTAELLDRFGSWYNFQEVLELIPATWAVEIVEGYLVGAFRRLVNERNEIGVVRALIGAQNLKVESEWVDRCREVGPTVENG